MSGPEFSHPAERERSPPEERLFNAGAMSDDQLIIVSRGISRVAEEGRQDHDDFDPMTPSDVLFVRFAHEVRNDLGARDPERLKGLTRRLTEGRLIQRFDEPDPERTLAALIVPGLIDYDYEFTRDTLVSLTLQEDGTYFNQVHEGRVTSTAILEIRLLMRDRLSAEQSADFNQHLAALPPTYPDWRFDPLGPAQPGETSRDE